jgi:hypothetical protein
LLHNDDVEKKIIRKIIELRFCQGTGHSLQTTKLAREKFGDLTEKEKVICRDKKRTDIMPVP